MCVDHRQIGEERPVQREHCLVSYIEALGSSFLKYSATCSKLHFAHTNDLQLSLNFCYLAESYQNLLGEGGHTLDQ